jgi:hypothetical protein
MGGNNMQRLVLGSVVCLLVVMAFGMSVSGNEPLFAPVFNAESALNGWKQIGPGQWYVNSDEEYTQVLRHENEGYDESCIYHEEYKLPLTFEVSARIKGTPNSSMYYWKGLVFYVDDLEFYVVRFSYDRDENNVQCNRYRLENGKLVVTNYSAGTLAKPIPAGEEVELIVKRQLVKVEIIVNGTAVQFTPQLMSLPAGAHIGFYNISANAGENCPAYFWDLQVSGL